MTAFNHPAQYAASNKAALETLLSFTNITFASAERLAALNLNTTRTMLEESLATLRSLLAAKTPQEMLNLQADLAQPAVEKAVAYARSAYEITAQSQEELSGLIENQLAELNKTIAIALDALVKTAPTGSEVAVSAVKSAIAATNHTFDSLNKAARQVAEIAETNMATATSATIKAVAATKGARKSA